MVKGSKRRRSFVSIKVSSETYEQLVKAQGALMAKFGRRFTLEDTLREIIKAAPKSELIFRPVEENEEGSQ